MGACTEPNHLAIVTELLPRGNLYDILHSNIEISLFQKLKWAKDVAQGMNWLHCSKPPIIHRDLKPTNLLVRCNVFLLLSCNAHLRILNFGAKTKKLALVSHDFILIFGG
jgi:serine/threonine protein kinase